MMQLNNHCPWSLAFATWTESDVAEFLGYIAEDAQRQGGEPQRTGTLVGLAVQAAIEAQGPPAALERDPRAWAAQLIVQAARADAERTTQLAVQAARADAEGPLGPLQIA